MKLSWAYVNVNATGRNRMVVYASKLAGLAGMHPYVNRDDLKHEILNAFDPESAMVPEDYLPPAEQEKRALDEGLTPTAKLIFDEAMTNLPSLEGRESIKAVKKALDTIKSIPGVSAEAKEAVRASLYTAHGIHGEDKIRVEASKTLGPIKTNARFTTSPIIFSTSSYDVFLGGKHDGMTGDTLTEIKNRMNRFLGVPLYERIQLHAYMVIYGVTKSILIESFKGERREHEVPFDDDLWFGVVESAEKFVRGVEQGVAPPYVAATLDQCETPSTIPTSDSS